MYNASTRRRNCDDNTGTETESKAEAKSGLLLKSGTFTDYSGRTFNCTAYEYAYWAKDTHMCRMLEAQMDDDTKAQMSKLINIIEDKGLAWQQDGKNHQTSHFDMKPLIDALQAYVDGYPQWDKDYSYSAMKAAWMKVGLAQRDLPVHVVNEYCRPGRSFDPLPAFNEDKLPRILTYYNLNTGAPVSLFPLVVSGSSGLGVDFALVRCSLPWSVPTRPHAPQRWAVGMDLAAVSRLDEVRTVDLTQSRKNLELIEPEPDHRSCLLM